MQYMRPITKLATLIMALLAALGLLNAVNAQTSNQNNPDFWAGMVVDGMQLQIFPSNSTTRIHIPVFSDPTFLSGPVVCRELLRGMAQYKANEKLMRGWRDPTGQSHPGLIGRQLAKGFTVHSNSSSEFSSNCTARTQMVHVNGGLTIDVKLAGNKLNLQLTQPTFLGSYADPKFTIYYDIHAWVTISIPQTAQQPLIAAHAVVEIGNFSHQGENFTGDLAEAGIMIYTLVRTNLLHQSSPVPQSLVLVNQSIQPKLDAISAKLRALPPNFRIDREYDGERRMLRLYATDRPPRQIERPK